MYRIALATGGRVAEIAGWPAAELAGWEAFERVYGPILPHERIDVGLATVAATVAAAAGDKQASVERYLPSWWQELVREARNDRAWESLLALARRNTTGDTTEDDRVRRPR